MKKAKLLLFLCLGFILSCQVDWIEKNEKTVERIDRDSKLISEIDTVSNGLSEQIKLFETKYESKLETNYKIKNKLDITSKFYSNDTIIFTYILKGLTPLLYKKKRKEGEPIGKLVEKIRCFKTKKYGIEKLREISIYEDDDIEIAKIKLSKKDFKSIEIGDKQYLETQMRFNRVLKVIK